jgi:hypothetical protein
LILAPALPLGRRNDGGIDWSGQHLLGSGQRVECLGVHQILAYDHQIDVARPATRSPSLGAIDKRDTNPLGKRKEGVPHGVDKPDRLHDQATQFLEDW